MRYKSSCMSRVLSVHGLFHSRDDNCRDVHSKVIALGTRWAYMRKRMIIVQSSTWIETFRCAQYLHETAYNRWMKNSIESLKIWINCVEYTLYEKWVHSCTHIGYSISLYACTTCLCACFENQTYFFQSITNDAINNTTTRTTITTTLTITTLTINSC